MEEIIIIGFMLIVIALICMKGLDTNHIESLQIHFGLLKGFDLLLKYFNNQNDEHKNQ